MPSDRDLRALRRMNAIDGPAVVRKILKLWDHTYGKATWRGGWLTLITGGWSENEAILSNLPKMFDSFYWWRSVRGGLHVYEVRRMK